MATASQFCQSLLDIFSFLGHTTCLPLLKALAALPLLFSRSAPGTCPFPSLPSPPLFFFVQPPRAKGAACLLGDTCLQESLTKSPRFCQFSLGCSPLTGMRGQHMLRHGLLIWGSSSSGVYECERQMRLWVFLKIIRFKHPANS